MFTRRKKQRTINTSIDINFTSSCNDQELNKKVVILNEVTKLVSIIIKNYN